MTDERWVKVWELFSAMRDLPDEERSAFLKSAATDVSLREEALALLEASASFAVSHPAQLSTAEGKDYQPDDQFGRYVIVGLIGHGGFGRIYAARDQVLRRVVALKILSRAVLGDHQRLIEEARAASALNHPNIVTVYETSTADGHLAIVMELVEGQSLRELLKTQNTPMPVGKVIHYGKQIAQALAAAHEAGIAHRDVKPENILVRKDGYIKLVDFGLAADLRAQAADQGANGVAGTLRYISPEQLRGERTSSASDVFSFGLVLYEMVTGAHPFQGASPLETASEILAAPLVPPARKEPSVPAAFDRLIVAMLSKTPNDRPTTAQIAQELERFGNPSAHRWTTRLPWAVAAMVALCAVLYFWLIRSPAPGRMELRLESRPLTGAEGLEAEPAISPDGRYVVYSWKEKPESKPVTLVREIGSDRTSVLPVPRPYAWLPDNEHIAFVRQGDSKDTLCTIARDGSGEQPVLQARKISNFAWTPDGTSVVYGAFTPDHDVTALFLYSLKTREAKQITFPPAESSGDQEFAVSPDGKQLGFRRTFSFAHGDIFVKSLQSPGPERRVTFQQTDGNKLAWITDGTAIISSTTRGAALSLWLHPLDTSLKPSRLTEVGAQALNVAAARQRKRFIWVNSLEDTNIWSVPVEGGNPARLIASTLRDADVSASSLGMLAFRSDRSGYSEIWIADRNGQSQKKVTSLDSFTGSPRWSPDGKRLAFDSRRIGADTDIFTTDCDPAAMRCGAPVQVTDHRASDALPSWTGDNRHLYFASQRSGQWQVWKTTPGGAPTQAQQMTMKGGYFATESADGQWLYYSRIDSERTTGIWRKALPGNLSAPFSPEDAGDFVLPTEFRATATWVLSGHEIYYEKFDSTGEASGIWVFDLRTRSKQLAYRSGEYPLGRGLAVSGDGRSILFVQRDRLESNIIVSDYEVVR